MHFPLIVHVWWVCFCCIVCLSTVRLVELVFHSTVHSSLLTIGLWQINFWGELLPLDVNEYACSTSSVDVLHIFLCGPVLSTELYALRYMSM